MPTHSSKLFESQDTPSAPRVRFRNGSAGENVARHKFSRQKETREGGQAGVVEAVRVDFPNALSAAIAKQGCRRLYNPDGQRVDLWNSRRRAIVGREPLYAGRPLSQCQQGRLPMWNVVPAVAPDPFLFALKIVVPGEQSNTPPDTL